MVRIMIRKSALLEIVNKSLFNSSEHPRGAGGRFINKYAPDIGVNGGGSKVENTYKTGKVNKWGEIYRQSIPNPIEAGKILTNNKSGYVENAFYSVKLNKEIGLCWGNDKCGIKKIIQKHIMKYKDFPNLEKALNVIDGILRNPTLKLEINELTNNYNISDGRYMVVLTKNDETGTFVIGSFKNIDTKKK